MSPVWWNLSKMNQWLHQLLSQILVSEILYSRNFCGRPLVNFANTLRYEKRFSCKHFALDKTHSSWSIVVPTSTFKAFSEAVKKIIENETGCHEKELLVFNSLVKLIHLSVSHFCGINMRTERAVTALTTKKKLTLGREQQCNSYYTFTSRATRHSLAALQAIRSFCVNTTIVLGCGWR